MMARSPPSSRNETCVEMARQPEHNAKRDMMAGRSSGDKLLALSNMRVNSTRNGIIVDQ